MTPDAAFGFERRGTPEALAVLGTSRGFEVVVVPPFTLDGRSVRSSDVRAAIVAGDLDLASTLLGRPVTLTGRADGPAVDVRRGLTFDWPMALPPDGRYEARVGTATCVVELDEGAVTLDRIEVQPGRVRVELDGRA